MLLVCLTIHVQAQKKLSWKKHVKLAEELFEKAQYADAGDHYRAAWKQKVKNKELIYKAGDCYWIIRDYKNAADALQHVKDQTDKYPLIGLKYARCLKQAGEYDLAAAELTAYINNYQGDDKRFVSDIVQNELRGCELGMELKQSTETPSSTVAILGPNINTPETEFAPFPFSDEVLYYSSTMAERAEIFRTQKINGQWSKPIELENFPVIENNHFCNGTLTPDQKRFYFTICESIESWGGLTTRCEIHVTRRVGNAWAAPEKLRDYINEVGVTTTHPFVVHQGNTEVLYFSSNREGGKGGMDIWYATRDINSNDNDFTFPINVGSKINSPGNEITPFYDQAEETFYFASNGQVTIGGYDIFKIKGAKTDWERVENVGFPYNSPADDFFFVKTPSKRGGFFVSNRLFGMEKITTVHEDIFEFVYSKPQGLIAIGGVYSSKTEKPLSDVTVGLYEMIGDGTKRFIKNESFSNGEYEFVIEPEKRYVVEAQKEDYFPGTYEFETNDYMTYSEYGAPIYLEEYKEFSEEELLKANKEILKERESSEEAIAQATIKKELEPAIEKEAEKPNKIEREIRTNTSPSDNRKANTVQTSNPDSSKTEETGYITRGKSSRDNFEIITSSPRTSGTYYKIQLIAVYKYNPNHSRYKPLNGMARYDTEYIVEKKLTRVLLADYGSYEEAKEQLKKVRLHNNFRRAFMVQYIDGERIGRVN